MTELDTFRKIVNWSFEEKRMTKVEILDELVITSKQFAMLMDSKNDKKIEFKQSELAAIQDFNKEYFPDMSMAKNLEVLSESEIEEPSNYKIKEDSNDDINIDSVKVIPESASHDLISTDLAKDQQEAVFYKQLRKLRSLCPDHITFDIMLKFKEK